MRLPAVAMLCLAAACIGQQPRRPPGTRRSSAPTHAGRQPLPPPPTALPAGGETTLREAARRSGRRFGVAVEPALLERDPIYRALVAREASSVTPENVMKWGATEPRRGQFTFGPADALVAFAEEHGIGVRGHTLVWHQSLPVWVRRLEGEALRAAMLEHVRAVAGHFRGRVYAWDVVNEAIADGTSGKLRADSPFTALGPSFLEDAFRAAHEADPEALLYYNDYDAEAVGPKSDAVFALVRGMKERGVPIHGVGLQMHLDPRRLPSPEGIRENLIRLTAIGLNVSFTEVDVPVGAIEGDPAGKWAAQRKLCRTYVGLCFQQDGCDGVTFWGLIDRYSWLNDPQWERIRGPGPHEPLLFDVGYQPKPAFQGTLDGMLGH